MRRDRRGSVALWIGLTLPTLLMALGLGIEVASWSVSQVELQRTADAASLAGAMNYTQTSSSSSAITAATNVAAINGISSANVTAAVVAGIKNASDTAIKVTVHQSVPLVFANIFSTLGSVTISAAAWSELVTSSAATGPQPCLGALLPAGSGGTGISMSGYTVITDPNCSLRSNASVTLTGNGDLSTGGIYAAGSITIPFYVTESGSENANDGTISDPYQSDSALQTALGQLSPGTGATLNTTNGNTTRTINPGTWSSWNLGGSTNLTLNPGLYIVNGPITTGGSTTLSGTGVTIINSGSITVGGSFTANLSAPGTSPTGGAVPGILMASTGSSVSFSGGWSFAFTGVLYYPKASVSMSGSTNLGSSGCAELIGGSLTFSGSANFSGSCSAYGAPSYGSLPATTTVSLVQ